MNIDASFIDEQPDEVDQEWQLQGNCLDANPDIFFPDRSEGTRSAKLVCRSCVVRQECLDFALANGEDSGIWGGRSPLERRFIKIGRRLRVLSS